MHLGGRIKNDDSREEATRGRSGANQQQQKRLLLQQTSAVGVNGEFKWWLMVKYTVLGPAARIRSSRAISVTHSPSHPSTHLHHHRCRLCPGHSLQNNCFGNRLRRKYRREQTNEYADIHMSREPVLVVQSWGSFSERASNFSRLLSTHATMGNGYWGLVYAKHAVFTLSSQPQDHSKTNVGPYEAPPSLRNSSDRC